MTVRERMLYTIRLLEKRLEDPNPDWQGFLQDLDTLEDTEASGNDPL